jgi:hypothetical protein
MKKTLHLIGKPARVSCAWVATGDSRMPLKCVWRTTKEPAACGDAASDGGRCFVAELVDCGDFDGVRGRSLFGRVRRWLKDGSAEFGVLAGHWFKIGSLLGANGAFNGRCSVSS